MHSVAGLVKRTCDRYTAVNFSSPDLFIFYIYKKVIVMSFFGDSDITGCPVGERARIKDDERDGRKKQKHTRLAADTPKVQ